MTGSRPAFETRRENNFVYENFSDTEFATARAVSQEVRQLSAASLASVTAAAKLAVLPDIEAQRIRAYFGLEAAGRGHEGLFLQLKGNIQRLHTAIHAAEITVIYRPDILAMHVPEGIADTPQIVRRDDGVPLAGRAGSEAPAAAPSTGENPVVVTLPFVHNPTRHAAASALYHEIVHRMLGARDHATGREASKALAARTPMEAMMNADSYVFYALSAVTRVI